MKIATTKRGLKNKRDRYEPLVLLTQQYFFKNWVSKFSKKLHLHQQSEIVHRFQKTSMELSKDARTHTHTETFQNAETAKYFSDKISSKMFTTSPVKTSSN